MKMRNRAFVCVALAISLGACNFNTGNQKSEPEHQAEPTTVFEGHWSSGCVAAFANTYITYDIHFTGYQYVNETKIFGADKNCLNQQTDEKHSGTFTIAGNSEVLPDAMKINITDTDAHGKITQLYDIAKIENNVLYFGTQQGSSEAERPRNLNRNLPLYKNAVSSPIVITPAPTQPSQPVQIPIPTTCTNFSGRYLMNMDNFEIKQAGCTHQDWNWQQTTGEIVTESYDFDGQERQLPQDQNSVNNVFRKSYFTADGAKFVIEFRSIDKAGKTATEKDVYYLSKQPCDLINPNGDEYLTRETYMNGETSYSDCTFWDKLQQ